MRGKVSFLRFTLTAIERSSTNFTLVAFRVFSCLWWPGVKMNLGMVGRSAAPLNFTINRMFPSNAPWGAPPGKLFEVDSAPWKFRTIVLLDR